MNNRLHQTTLLLPVILICIGILYYPALHSGFFLDDYPNLVHLAEIPQDGYLYYILTGVSSFLGRPLALLSFALQHESWPAQPLAFKIVNLVIHLLNGGMIFFVVRALSRYVCAGKQEMVLLSYSAAILWLVHPIQLSTMLYVIQRMTQLSTLFTLGGVLFYLHYRPLATNSMHWRPAVLAGFVIWLFTILAILCKENGILLPLYILILEFTLLRQEQYGRYWRIWAGFFLALPLLLLCIYLGMQLPTIIDGYQYRDYTMQQRLLTQAVVVSDYLGRILLPYPSAFSIYYDDFTVSTGLFQPFKTFWSLALIGALCTISLRGVRRWPVISFGILWFLGGHLLESTFLNLELYFEHRNYLPAFGVFIILGWAAVLLLRKVHSRLIMVLLLTYPLLVISITIMEIRLWAQPLAQAIAWSRAHPGSARALEQLGSQYIKAGDIPQSIVVYTQAVDRFPKQMYPLLKITALHACANDEPVGTDTWNALFRQAQFSGNDRFNLQGELQNIITAMQAGDCPGLAPDKLLDLIGMLAANPALRTLKPYLYEQASLLSLYQGDIYNSLHYVQQALDVSFHMSRLLFKAEALVTLGDRKRAWETLQLIESKMNYRSRLAYGQQVRELRKKLEQPEQTGNREGAFGTK